MSESTVTSVAIVGASAAGVTAAFELRSIGFDGSVTLFDRDALLPYERPPLSKALGRGTAELLIPIASEQAYSEAAIDLHLGVGVTELDARTRALHAGGQWRRFDRVLLATGARPRQLPSIPAAASNVHALRTAHDAVSLSASLRPGRRLVVIGGGFIGLEVAAAATTAGASVTIIEADMSPCHGVIGASVGARLHALHSSHGVEIRTGTRVISTSGSPDVHTIRLSTGESLAADVVVVAVGVEPNTELAEDCGAAVERGVIVDHTTATSIPGIFAAGDVAAQCPRLHHPRGGPIEHWTEATAHGTSAAHALLGRPITHGGVPFVWSNQFDHVFQMFGRPSATDELIISPGADRHQFRAFWIRHSVLVAAASLSHAPVLAGARNLIETAARLDPRELSNPDIPLRDIARRAARQRKAQLRNAS
ncbi:Benzene 1,2-dioxygenase system ferredoxin--NAD(+) reductase subunit (plasmid) [Mycobacterium sp. THAF192]|nr:Benzene 1,2-dioxygenase system ferredoxin--NAD(+) reductase subunit [Mycobacterium sp. THAF192]